MIVKVSKKFDKQYIRAPQEIQQAVDSRLDLFASNPFHPLLRNHKLSGEYEGYRSINITGDWRAVYYESDSLLEEPTAIFIELGTHSQLYR